MTRVRLMALAGALGAFGFASTSAEAQSMGNAPAPRYSYLPGGGYYYGGFYYAPQPAPGYYAPRYYAPAPVYRAPASSASRGRNDSDYDPTGRHDGLARPWLKPLR
jgi:hypothetical protein